jgi:predicted rRNA methylase YqxC with S4 and FtsJ domains
MLSLVPEECDLAVVDVSFISLTLVLPRIAELLATRPRIASATGPGIAATASATSSGDASGISSATSSGDASGISSATSSGDASGISSVTRSCDATGIASSMRPPAGKPIICLVKPQFEVGRDQVGKGGVVRDEAARRGAVTKIRDWANAHGFVAGEDVESPITGPAGNVEYLLLLRTA